MSTPQELLLEYETQLSEVKEMISVDPEDDSLVKLKADLEELIALTKSDISGSTPLESSSSGPENDLKNRNDNDGPEGSFVENGTQPSVGKETAIDHESEAATVATAKNPGSHENDKNTTQPPASISKTDAPKKKPPKTSKPPPPPSKFEIPEHLLPLDTDTEGERNRKRRTIKALKSKWRERVKEAAGAQRQKSWQSFMGKGGGKKGKKRVKGLSKSESIFRTEDGVHARVGVIGSGKGMTDFGERKRFKQT